MMMKSTILLAIGYLLLLFSIKVVSSTNLRGDINSINKSIGIIRNNNNLNDPTQENLLCRLQRILDMSMLHKDILFH